MTIAPLQRNHLDRDCGHGVDCVADAPAWVTFRAINMAAAGSFVPGYDAFCTSPWLFSHTDLVGCQPPHSPPGA